jgi:hypothetical protein
MPVVTFYTCFYNHARRLLLKKLLHVELSRSSSGYFKPSLDPGGGFTAVSELKLKRPPRKRFGNETVTNL